MMLTLFLLLAVPPAERAAPPPADTQAQTALELASDRWSTCLNDAVDTAMGSAEPPAEAAATALASCAADQKMLDAEYGKEVDAMDMTAEQKATAKAEHAANMEALLPDITQAITSARSGLNKAKDDTMTLDQANALDVAEEAAAAAEAAAAQAAAEAAAPKAD